ncbi:HECT protein [Rhizoctonia solani]|uniref:HECT-type E3 ubiquitin transferase n=1 Tax=Rhizoctonia solani TaxID=456999 RepID=A0A8H7ILH1_9AGAM|nr:HECT protein [Rhizoctonia solani]
MVAGVQARQAVRKEYANIFESGPGQLSPIEWTRSLLVSGTRGDQGEARLGRWSSVFVADSEALFAPFSTRNATQWLDILCRLSVRLLHTISASPQSPHTINHLTVLQNLLIPDRMPKHLPPATTQDIARSIITTVIPAKTCMYPHLNHAILSVDPKLKTSPLLPPLIDIALAPVSLLNATKEANGIVYQEVIERFIASILAIPSLPYRLPLPAVTRISSRFPFMHLGRVDLYSLVRKLESSDTTGGSAEEAKSELAANLFTFLPVKVLSRFKDHERRDYLNLLAATIVDDDSDTDSDVEMTLIAAQAPAQPLLSPRTRKRLEQLTDSAYLTALIGSHADAAVCRFFVSLWSAWPTRKDATLAAILALPTGAGATGGAYGIVKGIWRGQIRPIIGTLGDGAGQGTKALDSLVDDSTESLWPPLVFLTVLYTNMLRTMSDDEFFSTQIGQTPQTQSAQNPLSTSEVAHFGRSLLGVVFRLYLHEAVIGTRRVPGLGDINFGMVREWGTELLQSICLRDSRRKFTPEGHWLMVTLVMPDKYVLLPSSKTRNLPTQRYCFPHPVQVTLPRVQLERTCVFISQVQDPDSYTVLNPLRCTRTGFPARQSAEDGFKALSGMRKDMKLPISITFIDQWATKTGIDGGGVFKEFLTSLAKEVFDSDRGLWLANKQQELYPNPHPYAKESGQLEWFRFVGRVLGKALYDGILVDIAFAPFFLAKMLGRESYINDLASLDPELYQGLMFLKNYKGNPKNLGQVTVTNLVANGADTPVTAENRYQYILMVAHYRLKTQIRKQTDAFMEGLADIIDAKWIRMFDQRELQMLIGGTPDAIDIDDLRANCVYGGLYDESHEVIETFWKVVNTMNQEERRALLRFVTSCSRPPLLGFKELNPRFAIRDATSDDQRLPTSSTCLPRYSSEHIMRQKLLQAISSNAGFDLS